MRSQLRMLPRQWQCQMLDSGYWRSVLRGGLIPRAAFSLESVEKLAGRNGAGSAGLAVLQGLTHGFRACVNYKREGPDMTRSRTYLSRKVLGIRAWSRVSFRSRRILFWRCSLGFQGVCGMRPSHSWEWLICALQRQVFRIDAYFPTYSSLSFF